MHTEALHMLAGGDHQLSEHDHSHVELSNATVSCQLSTAALTTLFRTLWQICLAGSGPMLSSLLQCTCILPDTAQVSETAAGSSPRQTTDNLPHDRSTCRQKPKTGLTALPLRTSGRQSLSALHYACDSHCRQRHCAALSAVYIAQDSLLQACECSMAFNYLLSTWQRALLLHCCRGAGTVRPRPARRPRQPGGRRDRIGGGREARALLRGPASEMGEVRAFLSHPPRTTAHVAVHFRQRGHPLALCPGLAETLPETDYVLTTARRPSSRLAVPCMAGMQHVLAAAIRGTAATGTTRSQRQWCWAWRRLWRCGPQAALSMPSTACRSSAAFWR